MGREQLGWTAVRILLSWLLGCFFCILLYASGALHAGAAIALAIVTLGLSVASALITNRFLAAATRDAVADLRPEPTIGGGRPRRLSPAARAIRVPLLRLHREWREHAAQMERRLVAAEAVIAALPDPLILIDRQRRIVRANPASAEFIGAASEPRDLAVALRNPLLLAAADAVLQGDPARSVEFTISVPVKRVLRAHFARVEGPALAGAAAILTLHDVTALKRAEQMRADFVANAGHELKTPLATLIGFIETLLGPARDDAAARERFLGIMREQAQRMARLVDDLLSLSRIELNEHVAPTGRVALAPLIDEVLRALELRAGERNIRIVRELPDDLPDVQGDRDELAQIFQNLLDNAVKYGRPNSEVRVGGNIGNGAMPAQVQVVVVDQGDGIPSEHLPRLTERFYRVDTARSRELGGTGLGLAIVKHLLNRHRGRLEIASRVGQGSTFTVWLRAA
ncbi:MAG TPA: ATP-binding protein [Stellaceae bacterium]|jgi:two-component system phosphate regulon sensor histidine kinase PhoR|nr:ATP-binding protein [Stellaceae bacterium]